MGVKRFSIEEAFEFAWEVTKQNVALFIGLLVAAVIIDTIPVALAAQLQEKHHLLAPVFSIIGWVLQTIITMGLIKIAIQFADGQKGGFSDLFSCASLFIPYILGSFLYALIVLVGLVLLIVPGIIWAIRYQFFVYFIIDKKCKVFEAFQKSSEVTYGAKWRLFIFSILLTMLNFFGMIPLFMGLLVTIPITLVAVASVYRRLASAPAA